MTDWRAPAFSRRSFATALAASPLLAGFSGANAGELTQEDWRRHYGEQWHDLAKAKRRYDPDAVLASGPQLYFA